jgi:hypothetical protein
MTRPALLMQVDTKKAQGARPLCAGSLDEFQHAFIDE